MATLTLKNVPDDLHRRLKERAARNHRSLNREVIHALERAVEDARPSFREAHRAFVERHEDTLLSDREHGEVFGNLRSTEPGRPSPFEDET
ncbi:MAG: Arc family DNA-binding protein [Bacteroidota bacterium]